MAELETIDISPYPELKELAEAVQRTNEPRMLRVGDDDIAILMPVVKRKRRIHTPSKEDLEAFRSTAGGWNGLVDTDKLMADINESRRRSSRPRVDL